VNLAAAQRAEFSYPEMGATATTLPAGYLHIRVEQRIASGGPAFAAATSALASWELHRRCGIGVVADGPANRPGSTVLMRLGPRWLPGISAPGRVVYAVDEPTRAGFAYGTLAGHPETGEEAFIVRLEPDGAVVLTVTAFSRPASALARLGGPVTRRVQAWMTQQYVRKLRDLANGALPRQV
jgi:uncharacterized protein (UPF0548 family)